MFNQTLFNFKRFILIYSNWFCKWHQPISIFLQNGYVFRLSVVHYREMVLYKETVTTGMLKKDYESSAKMLDIEIVKRPLHTSLIHGYEVCRISCFHFFQLNRNNNECSFTTVFVLCHSVLIFYQLLDKW